MITVAAANEVARRLDEDVNAASQRALASACRVLVAHNPAGDHCWSDRPTVDDLTERRDG